MTYIFETRDRFCTLSIYLRRVLPGVGGGRVVMGGGKGVEAGVSLGVVEVGGRVVAGARLHLGVVVGVEEGRREVAGGHWCN